MVTFDHEDALRDMRWGVRIALALAVGALVCNLCDYHIVGSGFIGAIAGNLQYRLWWINKKLRSARTPSFDKRRHIAVIHRDMQ